ncbi:MAG: cell division protein FtsA [Candidatus Zixiibacteriota bacterium]
MAAESIVAALDIGTTKVFCLVGEMDAEGAIYVTGHGVAPADGLKRGVVVDMDKTVKAIEKAVGDAQMVSGVEIDRVSVGIAGEHIRSINSHGVVTVSRSDNEITAADVKRAIDAARTVALPVDREIIHVVPQAYSVDDQSGIQDPVGMNGVRLEVEAHIVTASVTTARNVYRALERCHLGVDHVVLEALALSQVLLNDTNLEAGCVLLDIGGDITSVSVFFDGAIRHSSTVSLGGRNVANDIAIGLRTSVSQAEELKIAHGAALTTHVDATEMIEVPGPGGRAAREISRNVLVSIIEPRMEEIFSLVARDLRQVVSLDRLASGMILTGGGAALAGCTELAEQIFDVPVRVGEVRGFAHVPDALSGPAFAAGFGLLMYGFANEPSAGRRGSRMRSWLSRLEDWITRKM